MSAADEALALRDAMDAFHNYLREAQQLIESAPRTVRPGARGRLRLPDGPDGEDHSDGDGQC